jgi:hypothetical protein
MKDATIFWDVRPCNFGKVYQYYGGTYAFIITVEE